jgi:hypothetical protein
MMQKDAAFVTGKRARQSQPALVLPQQGMSKGYACR